MSTLSQLNERRAEIIAEIKEVKGGPTNLMRELAAIDQKIFMEANRDDKKGEGDGQRTEDR